MPNALPPSSSTPATPRRSGSPGRELVLVAHASARLEARGTSVLSRAGTDTLALANALRGADAGIQPLFGASEARVQSATARLAKPLVRPLETFYRVHAADERLDALARALRALPGVAGAYVKPAPDPAELETPAPSPLAPPPVTPDFTPRQGYLEAAPAGIHARFAWSRPGGDGAGVRLVDVEGGAYFLHEDLLMNQGGLLGGSQSPEQRWRDHGTAALGVFGADANAFGVVGICPAADAQAISIYDLGSASAIQLGADALGSGDLLLIELHRPGPRNDFMHRPDLLGYLALEWWPDDLAAIQYATAHGVIVVEVAGNGNEDLADALFDAPAAGFPPDWVNPFRRVNDSGAILVGAGAPPPGTHGRSYGPDRSRLAFSNYGPCVDAQGWGREVTTTGYGDLQGGPDEGLWYTDRFAGSSSASAIVAGAVGAIQGAVRAAKRPPLTPLEVRALLRATGSAQTDAPGRPATQRIGQRPDLRQALVHLGLGGDLVLKPGPLQPTTR